MGLLRQAEYSTPGNIGGLNNQKYHPLQVLRKVQCTMATASTRAPISPLCFDVIIINSNNSNNSINSNNSNNSH